MLVAKLNTSLNCHSDGLAWHLGYIGNLCFSWILYLSGSALLWLLGTVLIEVFSSTRAIYVGRAEPL